MDTIESSEVKYKKPKDPKKIVSFVVSKFNELQTDRQSQIDLAMNLQTWAAMNQTPMTIYNTKGEKEQGFKDNKFATIVEVTTAQVANQSWSNMSQMFDVRSLDTIKVPEGLNEFEQIAYLKQFDDEEFQKQFIEEGENKAKLQKIALEQSLYKMKADVQLEKCFKHGDLFYGEKISWVGWKQSNQVQKLYGNKENVINYDNADIQAVDPISFVFDTQKFVKDDDDNFKKILKIHKRFETIENILNRKYTNAEGKLVNLYNLSSEDVESLKSRKSTTTTIEDVQRDDIRMQEGRVGDSYATYFVHGDFKIDGVEYKNYIAEVFADEFLIRFEPNPIYINPFIIQMDEQDPLTKRGIARMKTIFSSCVMRQNYINLKQQKDYLNGNPPTVMTSKMKQALIKDNSNVFQWIPGLIIEVDELSQDYKAIRKETFDTNGDINNISFITGEISDNGAVNANAMGNVEAGSNIKATDLQLAKQGQDIRLQQTLDSIYKFTIKNVEAVAQIKALFQSGIEILNVKDKNVTRLYAITDVIRQGQYEYRYEDRNALMNRHAKVDQAIQIVEKLSNVPEMANKFDYIECFETAMESIDYDNPEKFLKSDATIEGVMTEFQRLQPEQQMQLAQMLMQQLQQMQMQQAQTQGVM